LETEDNLLETDQKLGQVFFEYINYFKTYGNYCNDFDKIAALIRNQKKSDKKTNDLISKLEHEVKRDGGKDLNSYLILPVQRVPRYSLLLRVFFLILK
jgi:uncharacterized protein Yka (UPF0111/DUF47 family)